MSAVPSAEGGPRERVALGTLDFTVATTRRVGHSRLHRGGNASRWALSTSPWRQRVALGTLDFTAAVTSLDGAQGERVHAPWRLRLSTGPKASGCMSMSRSDVDKATPRVTRVEALSRVSPGFPPRAITCAGASTVVPLVHSPLVSPLSDTPIPHPVPSPPPAPGRVRVALGPVSACGGPPRGPAFSGPTCTTGAYRERAISKKHIAHFLGHASPFPIPRSPKSCPKLKLWRLECDEPLRPPRCDSTGPVGVRPCRDGN
jgi:hypothetical protein